MFWRRAFSAVIDIVFIYCIGYLMHLLIMRWIFINPFIEFAVSWVLYYSICYRFFNGRTLAKALTSLQVVSDNNERTSLRQILIRDVVSKFFILLVIPSYVIHRLHFYQKSQVLITVVFILALTLIMLVLFFIYKKPWWEMVASTKTIRNRLADRFLRFVSFIAIAGIFVITIYIKVSYYVNDWQHFGTRCFPEYPVNTETKKYADFIKTHSRDPVEYVFGLFDKYDLVVLDERIHPEYTQYKLISKIVGDQRFAVKVGNIYTECGSQSFQDTLNRYMNTVFPNEDTLNKITAWLQNNSSALWPIWGNTNLFDFLKYVNMINTHSADSLKINWYFTDIPVNWETMTPSSFQKIPRWDKRDKIMADRIAAVYKDKLAKNEKRKKGLVIMNHRHGFGLIRDRDGKKTSHFFNKYCTTALLMDALPGKVCNVLINRVPFGVFSTIFGPVQHGKWDKAFEIAGNPDVGFNFENSPFGSDNFDDYLWNSSAELQYKDVFTGFIFYKPLEQHINKVGFPYMLYHFEDSLIRRSGCLGESYTEAIKNEIINQYKGKTETWSIPYAIYYNWIVNIGFSFMIALALIICLIFYLSKMRGIK